MPAALAREADQPLCINHGCNTPVAYTNRSAKTGKKRWTVMCRSCINASQGRKKWKPGVTPWKTGYCRNQDQHLGFSCTVNYRRHPHFVGMTEVDHINGDHSDNKKSNLDELCPMCHRLKSIRAGDLGQLKTGERKQRKNNVRKL